MSSRFWDVLQRVLQDQEGQARSWQELSLGREQQHWDESA